MSYIGNQPYQVAFLTDTFNGDGTTTAFLSKTEKSAVRNIPGKTFLGNSLK